MIYFLEVGESCLATLGVIFFLRELLKVAYIVVPIGLIIMLSFDFMKVVVGSGESSNKAISIIIRRCISAMFVFLVPSVAFSLLHIVGTYYEDSESCWSYVDEVSVKEVKYILETQQSKLEDEVDAYRKEIAKSVNIKDKNVGLRRIIAKKEQSSGDSGDYVAVGKKYDLSYNELRAIAALCVQEQGSTEGVKAEASLMANRFELHPRDCTGCEKLYGYIENSKWWAKSSYYMSRKEKATDKAVAAVKDVLVDGNRTLPLYIDEHDCWNCNSNKSCSNGIKGDICSIVTDGRKYTSLSDITNRGKYSEGKTVINNVFGSKYTFYSFPTNSSDPFGYTDDAFKKYNKLNNHGGSSGKF